MAPKSPVCLRRPSQSRSAFFVFFCGDFPRWKMIFISQFSSIFFDKSRFGVDSPNARRRKRLLFFLYKLLNGLIHCNHLSSRMRIPVPALTKGHSLLISGRCRREIFLKSLIKMVSSDAVCDNVDFKGSEALFSKIGQYACKCFSIS